MEDEIRSNEIVNDINTSFLPSATMNDVNLDSGIIQINENSPNTYSGDQQDLECCSRMAILIKDECDDNFKKAKEEYEDPILKLDTLIQNFKDVFLDGRPDYLNDSVTFNYETIKIYDSKNGNTLLNENESEGCVLEHKSIKLLYNSDDVTDDIVPLITFEENVLEHCLLDDTIAEEKTEFELKEEVLERSSIYKVPKELVKVKDSEICSDQLTTEELESLESDTSSENKIDYSCITANISVNVEHNSQTNNLLPNCQPDLCVFKSLPINSEINNKFENQTFPLMRSNVSLMEGVFSLEIEDEIDIHEAIRRDDELSVRRLLAKGVDPDEPDWGGKGNPPLVQAAMRQNLRIVRLLCEAGCDVNVTSVRGETALHMAVSRRPVSLPLLDALLAAGCDPNVQDKLRGCSALHCVSGFADDEPHVFQTLVTVTDVNLRDHRHNTVLHRVAATSHSLSIIKQLMELGADLSVQNDRGETALSVALERGWEAGALALVTGGTDLHCTNLYRETPLHIAARHNQVSIVAALLQQGADVNAQDLAGNTALHLASGRGYVDVAHTLLACPNIDLDTHNAEGATPLTCAVESGFIAVVQMLVKAEKVDLQPALDLAKQGYRRLSQPEMCQLLTRELARRHTPHIN